MTTVLDEIAAAAGARTWEARIAATNQVWTEWIERRERAELDLADYLHSVDAEPEGFGAAIWTGIAGQKMEVQAVDEVATREAVLAGLDTILYLTNV